MGFIYLETVWLFESCSLKCVGWNQSSAQRRADYLSPQGKTFHEYLVNNISIWLVGPGTLPSPGWGTNATNPLESSFWFLLLTSCADQLSFLMPCLGNSGTSSPPDPELCLSTQGDCGLPPAFLLRPSSRSPSPLLLPLLPRPSPFPREPIASQSAGAAVGLTSFVFCLSEITALVTWRNLCLQNYCVIFLVFFFFLDWG